MNIKDKRLLEDIHKISSVKTCNTFEIGIGTSFSVDTSSIQAFIFKTLEIIQYSIATEIPFTKHQGTSNTSH